jgi:hypothetical protein
MKKNLPPASARPDPRRAGQISLAYLRYQALHPAGICATFARRRANTLDVADNAELGGCATIVQRAASGNVITKVAPTSQSMPSECGYCC